MGAGARHHLEDGRRSRGEGGALAVEALLESDVERSVGAVVFLPARETPLPPGGAVVLKRESSTGAGRAWKAVSANLRT